MIEKLTRIVGALLLMACFLLCVNAVGAPKKAKGKGKAKAAATKSAKKKDAKKDAKRDVAEEAAPKEGEEGFGFGAPSKEDEEALLRATDGQGEGACYIKLGLENFCGVKMTESQCLKMARDKAPAICYWNEGELECTEQKTPGLNRHCQGICGKDREEVNEFTFNIVSQCPDDPEFKDNVYCAIDEMHPAAPNEDLGLCGQPNTLGKPYDGICKRELPDKKAIMCGKGRP